MSSAATETVGGSGAKVSSTGWPTLPSADWDPYLRLVTIEEAAESVGRPQSTIRRWMSEGRMEPLAYMGRQPLLRESDVLAADAATSRQRRPRMRQ